MNNLKKYKRYVCFRALYLTDKLPKKKEHELRRLNKIIEETQKRILKLLRVKR